MKQEDRPSALKRVGSECVLQPKDRIVFWVLTVLGSAAVTFFLFSWFHVPAWGENPLVTVILSAILAPFLLNNLGRWSILRIMKKPMAVPARAGWRVAAVTTFVPGIEPLEMLERTLKALVALDYPHDIWVLDEGNDHRVKQLCAALGVHHFSRLPYPHYQTEVGIFRKASKYGNYNAWLHEVGFERYDILAAFDPDHLPHPVFLSKVLGYFDDPRVGYVQAPQAYSNQQASFIARGAAEETYDFYSVVQMAYYGKNFPVIIGSHNTHRLDALREFGGFAPHDADDLLLTLLYHAHGWQGVYVPEILALGLAPADWPTYLNQQRRWTRSLLDIKLRVAPSLARNLTSTAAWLNFLHGMNYVFRSIVFPIALILVAAMMVFAEMPDFATAETIGSGIFTMGMLYMGEMYRRRFYLNGKLERGFHWRAGLLRFARWPYQLAAVADVLVNRRFPYVTTPKVPSPRLPSFVLWPHWTTLALLGFAWGIGLVIHGTLPVALQLCAGGIVAVTVGLLATEWRGMRK